MSYEIIKTKDNDMIGYNYGVIDTNFTDVRRESPNQIIEQNKILFEGSQISCQKFINQLKATNFETKTQTVYIFEKILTATVIPEYIWHIMKNKEYPFFAADHIYIVNLDNQKTKILCEQHVKKTQNKKWIEFVPEVHPELD